jgi:steroid delta-isomerase-like uncharacterized protein
MGAIDVARAFYDAFNRHDVDAIAAVFAEDGTLTDGAVGTISGEAIADYARAFFEGFPDISWEVTTLRAIDDGLVAAEWICRGRNTGPLMGSAPTGRTIAVPGAEFIEIADDRVRAVRAYWDQKVLADQLA